MKVKGRLRNCPRMKETKERWRWDPNWDSKLDLCYKRRYRTTGETWMGSEAWRVATCLPSFPGCNQERALHCESYTQMSSSRIRPQVNNSLSSGSLCIAPPTQLSVCHCSKVMVTLTHCFRVLEGLIQLCIGHNGVPFADPPQHFLKCFNFSLVN